MKHNIVDRAAYKNYFTKKLNYINNSEKCAYMKGRQAQNLAICGKNKNENWFWEKIRILPYKFSRQRIWGYRLFDFWSHELGCAIEIDGPEHDERYDEYRDLYNFMRSGIIVIRVKNMNEQDAQEAIKLIETLSTWKQRREDFKITSKISIV